MATASSGENSASRRAVYAEGESVTLPTIRPTAMIEMFKTPELKAVAEDVESVIVRIMGFGSKLAKGFALDIP